MRKSGNWFSARVPLYFSGIDHVYGFGLIQSKAIEIYVAARAAKLKIAQHGEPGQCHAQSGAGLETPAGMMKDEEPRDVQPLPAPIGAARIGQP